jgi:hypothetical protein
MLIVSDRHSRLAVQALLVTQALADLRRVIPG